MVLHGSEIHHSWGMAAVCRDRDADGPKHPEPLLLLLLGTSGAILGSGKVLCSVRKVFLKAWNSSLWRLHAWLRSGLRCAGRIRNSFPCCKLNEGDFLCNVWMLLDNKKLITLNEVRHSATGEEMLGIIMPCIYRTASDWLLSCNFPLSSPWYAVTSLLCLKLHFCAKLIRVQSLPLILRGFRASPVHVGITAAVWWCCLLSLQPSFTELITHQSIGRQPEMHLLAPCRYTCEVMTAAQMDFCELVVTEIANALHRCRPMCLTQQCKPRSDQTIQLCQILRVFKQCWFWYYLAKLRNLFFSNSYKKLILPFLCIVQDTLGFSRFTAWFVCLENFEPALAVSLSNVATTSWGILSVTDPGVYFWSNLLNI